MTAMALRLSGYCNGVSARHGDVARRMWHPLWPDRQEDDVPIDAITNGVHVPTWIEPKMELLFNSFLWPDWIADHDDPATWQLIDEVPDRELWEVHIRLKMKLINFIHERARRRWVANRAHPITVVAGGTLLDPAALTIGFARRFATYKRAALLLHDPERLRSILIDRRQPVQIILAGKAHPADDEGKRILQRVFTFAARSDFAGRIAFVEDYDEQLAQYLTHGVDVWLNCPLPPPEACGTSGMKASLNSVPHPSIRDGWWFEGFNGSNGWSFGRDDVTGDRTGVDAEAVYSLIGKEIKPLYYTLDEEGVPHQWVRMMREAIKGTAHHFSARRMIKEYSMRFYQKALRSAAESSA